MLGLFAALHVESLVDAVERAVIVPLREVAVDCAAGRQVLRDRPQLAACARHIHQPVHHLADAHRSLAAAPFGPWDDRRDERPFLVCQVAGVAKLTAVVAASVLVRPHQRHPANRDRHLGITTDSFDSRCRRTDTKNLASGRTPCGPCQSTVDRGNGDTSRARPGPRLKSWIPNVHYQPRTGGRWRPCWPASPSSNANCSRAHPINHRGGEGARQAAWPPARTTAEVGIGWKTTTFPGALRLDGMTAPKQTCPCQRYKHQRHRTVIRKSSPVAPARNT